LFDWNRELMDDDYNDGQQFVVKHKKKAGNCEFGSTVKIGEQKDGKNKLAVEEKIKVKLKDFMGGVQSECKLKNNGDLVYECESDCLKVSYQTFHLTLSGYRGTRGSPNLDEGNLEPEHGATNGGI
jgi:hypothetical protein